MAHSKTFRNLYFSLMIHVHRRTTAMDQFLMSPWLFYMQTSCNNKSEQLEML